MGGAEEVEGDEEIIGIFVVIWCRIYFKIISFSRYTCYIYNHLLHLYYDAYILNN